MSLTKISYSMISGAPVNVLDYGADPTGATSSQSAFVAALATGKSVYIPKGTYLVTGGLVLPEYSTMFGDGPNLSKIQCNTSSFSGVCLTVGGRCEVRDFSITAINEPTPLTATGVYFASADGPYNFTGHSSATNVQVQKFNVGFLVNNFFDLEFHRCEAYQNNRGWELSPQYIVSQDSGYYTTITLIKCYSAFNQLEGFYASSTVNGRVLHFIDCAVEFNCVNDSTATAEIAITRCFQVAFSSCYTESSVGTTKPWLLLNNVSTCSIDDHFAVSTQGVNIGNDSGQLTMKNSTIGKLVGAASGAGGQNIYAVGCSIGVTTIGSTVTQRYISTTVDGSYRKDLAINNQIRLIDDTANTSTLNSFQLFTKTVTATISANSNAALITDQYFVNVWEGDTVATASITNLYNPGLLLQVTPATTGDKNYFNVRAVNTTASPITITSAQLKVAFIRGYGMAI
ncbi:hypothetical protein EBT31_03765 [bacterium]|nr:hypothetical protein [bacterium]